MGRRRPAAGRRAGAGARHAAVVALGYRRRRPGPAAALQRRPVRQLAQRVAPARQPQLDGARARGAAAAAVGHGRRAAQLVAELDGAGPLQELRGHHRAAGPAAEEEAVGELG